MFRMNDYDQYEMAINGVRFVCEEVEEGYAETAARLAEIYHSKLESIAQFLLNEDICDFFGKLTAEQIIASLGVPEVDLDSDQIIYAEHQFNNPHIISFEFEGMFDAFHYLCIDG